LSPSTPIQLETIGPFHKKLLELGTGNPGIEVHWYFLTGADL